MLTSAGDLDNGRIDVDPEYQREVVWTGKCTREGCYQTALMSRLADRMTGLINSLMENFYIPPIILNKKTRTGQSNEQEHEPIHVCVDGKQRLSSVRAFVKGMIPCEISDTRLQRVAY
jgi:hypothetical protein